MLVDACFKIIFRPTNVQAYSPLARGQKLDDPTLAAIAEKLGVTPVQIMVKYVWTLCAQLFGSCL